jgi:neutral ceramidase
LPPDNSNRSMSFIPGVVRDGPPLLRNFGDVLADTEAEYRRGDAARATFVGANPRNNLRLEGTYCAVERRVDTAVVASDGDELLRDTAWEAVRDDADWGIVFEWRRTSEILATSEATVTWEIEGWAEPGVYRLRYFGDAKSIGGGVTAIAGISGQFRVA